MSRFRRDQSGATAIEFAFAATALLLLTFAIIEFGRMIWTQQVLQAAATATARCLALGSPQCPNGQNYAVTMASNRGVADVQSGNVAINGNTACGSATGTFTQVTITYTFVTVVPAYIPVPNGGLTATACYPH